MIPVICRECGKHICDIDETEVPAEHAICVECWEAIDDD